MPLFNALASGDMVDGRSKSSLQIPGGQSPVSRFEEAPLASYGLIGGTPSYYGARGSNATRFVNTLKVIAVDRRPAKQTFRKARRSCAASALRCSRSGTPPNTY
jgi:hypothetical protein